MRVVCGQCATEKPAAAFSVHTKGKLRTTCKACRAADAAAKRNAEPERTVLSLMVQRCHNPRHPKYAYYGGRGVSVCAEWRASGGYERFLAHVGPRPSAGHSIDRIDNARGYEPGNVRWATRSEQMRNTRRTVQITALGQTRTLDGWAEHTGIPKRTLEWRRSAGWPDERTVSEPVHRVAA